jgi:hypothetical protein
MNDENHKIHHGKKKDVVYNPTERPNYENNRQRVTMSAIIHLKKQSTHIDIID